MRITCPSCTAQYEVPDSRLRPGKLVRCARCGSDWLPAAEPEEIVPETYHPEPEVAEVEDAAIEEPLPQVTAMDRLAASSAPSPSRGRLIGAWVLTFAVLAAAAAAAFVWRDDVVRAWPPSSRILTSANDNTAAHSMPGQSPAMPARAPPGAQTPSIPLPPPLMPAQTAGKNAE